MLTFIALAFTRSFPFTIAFTLCTEIVAQHGAQDKVFLGCQFIEWTGDNEADGVETLLAANIEVQVILTRSL